ncbi:27912_t:CDS:2 [Dentiscutata erythropus]|uniref:27912_t:CDS:1 n=1 Tax=Dentiscutata erythropus TaxID=1348616 RepID=A0A9N9I7L0_9GLOM|nr:27912_t:CDS:2 [Dentiscutata erythropus]
MITSGVFATVVLAKTVMRARSRKKETSHQSSLLFEDWKISFNLPPKLIVRCAVCWRRRTANGYWCQYCESRRFRENFSTWTSGNCNFAHDASLALEIAKGLRPQILEGTPKKYVELMKLCWQMDPEGRPNAAELVKKLEMLMNDQEINNGVVLAMHIDEAYHPDAVYTSRALQFPDLKNAKFDSNSGDIGNDTNVYITKQFELSLENLPLD